MSQPKFRILIADPVSERCRELFSDASRYEVVEAKLRGEELLAQIGGFDALIVRSGCQVTAEVLSRATRLKAVARAGAGVDNIDTDEATRRGVLVMNTPGGNTIAAAEHTLALTLALLRKIPAADAAVRAGGWRTAEFVGAEMRGRVLGVVGLGKIGREVARRAKAFDVELLGFDPVLSAEAAATLGVELCPLAELLTRADIVTVHVPLNDATRHLIGAEQLATMKPDARIVNCARGGIIDEAALAEALNAGRIAGAALDVFEAEPLPAGHPLLSAKNLVLTPHLGASTEEAQESVGIMSGQQIKAYLERGEIRNAVNTIALDAHELDHVSPFVDLARKLGSLQAQIGEQAPRRITVRCAGASFEGERAGPRRQLVTLAVLEGFFRHFLDAPVNRVSVPHFAREHGITITEEVSGDSEGFASLLTVEVEGAEGKRVISGTLFGTRAPRLVLFDAHRFDAIPEGTALIFQNEDKPGVLGQVCSILGEAGVNIANVTLGCLETGQRALAFMNIEARPDAEVLSRIQAMPGLPWVRVVEFG